jgi:hypothetical protein
MGVAATNYMSNVDDVIVILRSKTLTDFLQSVEMASSDEGEFKFSFDEFMKFYAAKILRIDSEELKEFILEKRNKQRNTSSFVRNSLRIERNLEEDNSTEIIKSPPTRYEDEDENEDLFEEDELKEYRQQKLYLQEGKSSSFVRNSLTIQRNQEDNSTEIINSLPKDNKYDLTEVQLQRKENNQFVQKDTTANREPSYTALSQSSKGVSLKVWKEVGPENVSDIDTSDAEIKTWKPTKETKPKRANKMSDSENVDFVDKDLLDSNTPLKSESNISKRVKWSEKEINTLLKAFEDYKDDDCKWSNIIKDPKYKETFKSRTGTNLKDKYRNILKSRQKVA